MSDSRTNGSPNRPVPEGRVLGVLRRTEKASPPVLARETGLARATVVSLAERLRDKDLVEIEEGRPGPSGGRPGTLVSLKADAGFALAIHFAHRHVRAAAGNLLGYKVFFPRGEGESVATLEAEVDVGANAEESLATAVKLIREAMKGRDKKDLVAVTVGWPAPVRSVDRGEVVIDETLEQWLGIGRPAERLKKLLGWPKVTFLTENDANLGALMEMEHGAGHDYSNFIYVHWNSGIGGAAVIDGVLRRGESGLAGEIGHIPVDVEERHHEKCRRCGSTHCLEVLAGGTAVVNRVRSLAPDIMVESLSDVIELAHAGSPRSQTARLVLNDAAQLVGKALGPLVTWSNPSAIVVGGHFGQDEERDPFSLISKGLLDGLQETAAPAALRRVQTTGSQWRYGAVQGGVVLGLQEGLESFVEDRLVVNGRTP
jgi:predicted NBD/HSP70 family sugar kinase